MKCIFYLPFLLSLLVFVPYSNVCGSQEDDASNEEIHLEQISVSRLAIRHAINYIAILAYWILWEQEENIFNWSEKEYTFFIIDFVLRMVIIILYAQPLAWTKGRTYQYRSNILRNIIAFLTLFSVEYRTEYSTTSSKNLFDEKWTTIISVLFQLISYALVIQFAINMVDHWLITYWIPYRSDKIDDRDSEEKKEEQTTEF